MTDYAMTLANEPRWEPGKTFTVLAYYALTGAVASGDTFTATNMLPAQKVEVISGKLFGKEMDTHASPTGTVIVGDGTDTDAYLASQVWGSANQQFHADFDGAVLGTTNAASRNIVSTLGGTVATAASSGTVWKEVTYVCSDGARIS